MSVSRGREYPDRPLVGVGAVVIDGEGRILLVRRGVEPGLGLWSIPGGLVELGERVMDAVVREVREETGVEVEVLGIAEVFDNIVLDERGRVRFHYVLIDYYAKPLTSSLRRGSDALEVGWFTPEEAERLEKSRATEKLLRKIGFLR